MFSKLLRVSIPPSSSPVPRSPSTISSRSNSSSGLQLQFELALAAEKGMVSTRSQDHTPARGVDDGTIKHSRSTSARGRKRKAVNQEDIATPSGPAAKRTRATSTRNSRMTSSPKTVQEGSFEDDKHNRRHSDIVRVEVIIRPDSSSQEGTITVDTTSSSSPPPEVNEPRDPTDEEMTMHISTKPQDDHNEPESAPEKPDGEVLQSSPSKPAKKLKKSIKAENEPETDIATLSPKPKPTDFPTPSANPPSKATHKRFNTEDPELPNPQSEPILTTEPQIQEPEPTTNDTSDDEAPETVTASAGQDQARSKALEEAQAAATLKKQRKLKRKERDEQLKAQKKETAEKSIKEKASSKKSKRKAPKVEPVDEDNAFTPPEPQSSKRPIPALLPAHILAEEPTTRLLNPPQTTHKGPLSQKKKFLDLEPKPPKDIRRDGVRIRVLQEQSSILPPKASRNSKLLREAWLMGRRGKYKGVERRKVGGGTGGFVRR